MENGFYFVFLVIAVFIGYILGGKFYRSSSLHRIFPFLSRSKKTPPRYLLGLAQVLNNEPDAAIETFTENFVVDANTLDTHLALGALLRRRGEVDKATHVHKNILGSSTLTAQQMQRAQLALALDYQQAGLLDRAEVLFKELITSADAVIQQQSLKGLGEVFEQEQEWGQAIKTYEALKACVNEAQAQSIANLQAHFHCELAEALCARGQLDAAIKHLEQAITCVPAHPRTVLLICGLLIGNKEWAAALQQLLPLAQFKKEVMAVVPLLAQVCNELRQGDVFAQELRNCYQLQAIPNLVPLLASVIYDNDGKEAAIGFLCDELSDFLPFKALGAFVSELPAQSVEFDVLLDIVKSAVETDVVCDTCGFESQQRYWRCPTCKTWH